MSRINRIKEATVRGMIAILSKALNADPLETDNGEDVDFESYAARHMRYETYMGYKNNNFWDESVHPIAAKHKTNKKIYKYIRHIYNPTARMVEFWQTHIFGGPLDPKAGDGEVVKTSIPILADNDDVRRGLERLWSDSFWAENKDMIAIFCASLGDVAVRVRLDDETRAPRLKVEHPGKYTWVDWDNAGRVIAYVYEELRYDPASKTGNIQLARRVWYREEAKLVDGRVRYETFKDGKPYSWDGEDENHWFEDWPFIPLVFIQHEPTGLAWGNPCNYAALPKFQEVDQQASILSDQNRKSLMAPTAITGLQGLKDLVVDQTRDQMGLVYVKNVNAKSFPLLGTMDVKDVLEYIIDINMGLEKDYPELMHQVNIAQGDATGKALKIAARLATTKVQAHRPAYDSKLVMIQRMALAIGGKENIEGYNFSIEDYNGAKTLHSIAHRTVFDVDPSDEQMEVGLWLDNAVKAQSIGIEPYVWFEEDGMPPEKVAKFKASMERTRLARLEEIDRSQNPEGGKSAMLPAPHAKKEGENEKKTPKTES